MVVCDVCNPYFHNETGGQRRILSGAGRCPLPYIRSPKINRFMQVPEAMEEDFSSQKVVRMWLDDK